MVLYTFEEKVLIIPEGAESCDCSGGVSKNCEKEYRKGYDEGFEDGLEACSGYTPTDCSSAITEAYSSGVTAGKAEQEAADRAKLEILNVYANGIYEPEYGYKGVGVHISELRYLDLKFYFTEPAQIPIIRGLRNCIVNGNADVTYGMSAGGEGGGNTKYITTKSIVQTNLIFSASFEMAILPDESTFPSEIDYMVFNAEANPMTAITASGGYLPIAVEYVGTGTTDVGGVETNCEWYRLSFNNFAFTPFDNWQLAHFDGYIEGLNDCSGSTDCSSAITSAFTQGYQSGTTDGYAEGHRDGYSSGYTAGVEASSTGCDAAVEVAYASGVTAGEEDAKGSIFSLEVKFVISVLGDRSYAGQAGYPPLYIIDTDGNSHQLNYIYSESPKKVRHIVDWIFSGEGTNIVTEQWAGYLQDGARYITPHQVIMYTGEENTLSGKTITGLSVRFNGEVIHNYQPGGSDYWEMGDGGWKFDTTDTEVGDLYIDTSYHNARFKGLIFTL